MSNHPKTASGVVQFIDANRLKSDLEINEIDLSASMMRHAGLFAHYAVLHSQAELQFAKKEQLLEVIESRVDKEIRDKAVANAQKITEAAIEKQVRADPRYIRAKSIVNEARQVSTLAKMATDTFRHRKDMLIQTAQNQREERNGELRVTDRAQQIRRSNREDLVERLRRGPDTDND
jgi:hypothetical protein